MKHNLLFLLFVFVSLISQAQSKPPALVFEETSFDFGTIMEKEGKVSHTFIFRNTGSQPVTINNVVAGCGCITHQYTKETVKPGGKGEVTVTYNPNYRPGKFSMEITVLSDNGRREDWLWIKGNVIPCEHPVEEDYPYAFGDGLYLHLRVLSFPRIGVGASAEIILRYANDTDKPMTLEFVPEGDVSTVSFTNPGMLQAKERGQMIVKYTMADTIDGEFTTRIYPVVNGGKPAQPLLLKVAGSK